MGKLFLRGFFLLIIILISITIFLSYFGIETDKFDGLIKNRANEKNKNVKLGFQNTKIHLNPTELNLIVKLQNPKILIKEDEIINAMQLIWERMKIIIEPSCAVPFAALLKNKKEFKNKNVGIILSGGNVDVKNLPF